jgi:hypothetical protein
MGEVYRAIGTLLLLLILILAALVVQATAQEPETGTIDLDTASRLVADYIGHVVSRLPRDWRRQEEQRWKEEPPGLRDSGGIYQFTGPDGHIAFEHDAETRRLLAYSLVFKPREEYPRIGLTREEILTGLKRAVASGVDTGGGELIFEPESGGFFLMRAYSEPPESPRRLQRDLDRLMASGEGWFREHYLEAVLAHAETMRPPPSATVKDGDFELTLLLTPDIRYHELWKHSVAVKPQLVSRPDYTRGQEVWTMALFTGAAAGPEGTARYEAQFSFVYPNGEAAGSQVFVLWDGPPPTDDTRQTVEKKASIELGEDMEAGDYMARVKACNAHTGRCVEAVSPFRLLADPGS